MCIYNIEKRKYLPEKSSTENVSFSSFLYIYIYDFGCSHMPRHIFNNGIGFSGTFSFNKFLYFRQTEIWMSLLFVWMDFHFRVSNCETGILPIFQHIFRYWLMLRYYTFICTRIIVAGMTRIVHSTCSWFLMVGEKQKK